MRREACGFGDFFWLDLFVLFLGFFFTVESLQPYGLVGTASSRPRHRCGVRETTFCFVSIKTRGLMQGISESGGGGAAAADVRYFVYINKVCEMRDNFAFRP